MKSNLIGKSLFGKDNPNSKKIMCFYQNGRVKEYESLTDASKEELVSITSISPTLK